MSCEREQEAGIIKDKQRWCRCQKKKKKKAVCPTEGKV